MDKRTGMAVVLCGLMTVAYLWYMNAHRPPPSTPPPAPIAENAPAPDDETSVPPREEETTPPPVTEAVPPRDDIAIGGDDLLYTATLTNRGAAILDANLVEYKQTVLEEKTFHLLGGVDKEFFDELAETAALKDKADLVAQAKRAAELAPYRSLLLRDPTGSLPLDTTTYETVEESPERFAFAATMPNGVRVTKEFIPRPGKNEMGFRLTFENPGESERTVRCEIVAAARVLPEGGSNVNIVGAAGVGEDPDRVEIERVKAVKGKLRKTGEIVIDGSEKPIRWVGSSNRYFATVLIPKTSETSPNENIAAYAAFRYLPSTDAVTSRFGGTSIVPNVSAVLGLRPLVLEPGKEVSYEFTYFMGPMKGDVLKAEDYRGIANILNYGWPAPISRALLGILKFFYKLIPNYGIGIILLTFLVKLCLHPLTKKGQISMHRMQKLQPLIRELQAKHKNDKQRLSQEQMKLFREHNANPMSGCMPMLFQLPVIFGLFRMLQNAAEIRHQGFVFWIQDLSSPDMAFHIGSFPLNVLPILMVVSWLAQQAMMPKPVDPQQAQSQKIMKFMPVFFGYICYGMASGLVLYWLTSTFLGILEQKLIKIEIARMEKRGQFPAVTAETVARPKPARKPKRK